MQKYRSYVLPFAILLGLFFHSYISRISFVVPYLIGLMLFFTYSSIQVSKMHIHRFDIWLILFQLLASIGVYFIIKPFNLTMSEGALVTILTPTATSAVVIAVLLGGNLTTMGVYTLLSNLVVAIVAPLYFSLIGNGLDIPFYESFGLIMVKIAPLLLLPFLFAIIIKKFLPKLNESILKLQFISFYLWAIALTIVIANIIHFINDQKQIDISFIVFAFCIALILCEIQFALGKFIGNRYGDKVSGGQSLGQKNTVLAIWMAQTFFNPLSSLIPAIYVILQNVYNSYQLSRHEASRRKQL